jgi:hypothetical protein
MGSIQVTVHGIIEKTCNLLGRRTTSDNLLRVTAVQGGYCLRSWNYILWNLHPAMLGGPVYLHTARGTDSHARWRTPSCFFFQCIWPVRCLHFTTLNMMTFRGLGGCTISNWRVLKVLHQSIPSYPKAIILATFLSSAACLTSKSTFIVFSRPRFERERIR